MSAAGNLWKRIDGWFYVRAFLAVSLGQAAIACASAPSDKGNSSHLASHPDQTVVTVSDVVGLMEQNSQNPGARLELSNVEIRGNVSDKVTGLFGEPMLGFGVAEAKTLVFGSIEVDDREKANAIEIGDQVTLSCASADRFKNHALLWSCGIRTHSDANRYAPGVTG